MLKILFLFGVLIFGVFVITKIPLINPDELLIPRVLKPETNTQPRDEQITIIATGDIIPARSVNYQATSRNNFRWPFEKTADVLKTADITFGNLESPLISDCPVTTEGMVFCGDARNVEGLVFAGIDIVSVANNHAGDHGLSGVKETKKFLEEKGIYVTGISGPVYKSIKGIRLAFLGYNDIGGKKEGVSFAKNELVSEEIAKARKEADILIVTFHWGVEYATKITDRQKELSYLAIDSGADLVIGNHPHWIQPIEIYKDKLIVYAHGNFIFDQEWSQKTKEGVVGKYVFSDKKLLYADFLPVKIKDYGQPYFLEGEDKQRILDEMKLGPTSGKIWVDGDKGPGAI